MVEALFLKRHLWTNDRPVSELKKLALLTLSYAAEESPASIGPPFDIITLEKANPIIHEESHDKVTHAGFKQGLARLFGECDFSAS